MLRRGLYRMKACETPDGHGGELRTAPALVRTLIVHLCCMSVTAHQPDVVAVICTDAICLLLTTSRKGLHGRPGGPCLIARGSGTTAAEALDASMQPFTAVDLLASGCTASNALICKPVSTGWCAMFSDMVTS